MTTIHVHHTPLREHSRRDFGDRWCFQCRKRLPHELVVLVPTDPYSYYGPSRTIECSGCGEDHTAFPGTAWEWVEDE